MDPLVASQKFSDSASSDPDSDEEHVNHFIKHLQIRKKRSEIDSDFDLISIEEKRNQLYSKRGLFAENPYPNRPLINPIVLL